MTPSYVKSSHSQRTQRLTVVAMLVAIGMVLHLVEAAIPLPVQIPGVKLGLANIVTLVAFFSLGPREAFWVALLRVVMGSLLAGSLMTTSFFLSLGGALAAYAVIFIAYLVGGDRLGLPGISALASVGHVTGQLGIAAVIISHPGIFFLAPAIYGSALVTGFLTGYAADLVLARLSKTSTWKQIRRSR